MSGFAYKYSTVVDKHFRVQKSKTSVKVFNFTSSTGMRSVNYFNNILFSYSALSKVQCDCISAFATLRNGLRSYFDYFPMYRQDMEILMF